jgi:hypothetical protein
MQYISIEIASKLYFFYNFLYQHVKTNKKHLKSINFKECIG